jgi:hypothetical protein
MAGFIFYGVYMKKLLSALSNAEKIVGTVSKALNGKAKQRDFANTTFLGSANENLEALNTTIATARIIKKYLK